MIPRVLIVLGVFASVTPACDTEAKPPEDIPSGIFKGCDGQTYPTLDATPYALPFPEGTAYVMNLGNCSTSFHGPSSPDRYAYDFAMDIGTPVTASRAGEVVHVVESGMDGSSPNNLVVVRHDDDTYAQYMHLTHNGADVEVGDTVRPGDAIGRSGNTGLAGTPHLHVIVTIGGWPYPYTPTPVSFSNASPRHLVLRQGVRYTATSP